jgi:hypothetical protein
MRRRAAIRNRFYISVCSVDIDLNIIKVISLIVLLKTATETDGIMQMIKRILKLN